MGPLGEAEPLASALRAARRPAFVAGAEVDRDGAVPALTRLAEAAGAWVWQAPMSGRCSFPETHPLFAGHLPADPLRLSELLAAREHDLVVGLGRTDSYHTYTGPATPPIRWVIAEDEDVLARSPGAPVRAAVGEAVRFLDEAIGGGPSSPARSSPARPRPEAPEASDPLTAAYVYHTISVELPDASLVEEAPAHRRDLHTYLPISAPEGGGYLTATAGCLGYGLAAAVGVALAKPERTVVSVVGDGSAMYTIRALWTASQQRTSVTWVVLDNGGYARCGPSPSTRACGTWRD